MQRARSIGHATLQLLLAIISTASAYGCLKGMPNTANLWETISVGVGGINMIEIAVKCFNNFIEELKRPTKREIEENPTEFTIEKVDKMSNKRVKKTKFQSKHVLMFLSQMGLFVMAFTCIGVGTRSYSVDLFEMLSSVLCGFGLAAKAEGINAWNYSEEDKQKEKTK